MHESKSRRETSPTASTRRDGAATRKKLLEAARAIVVEEGTDKLSIDRVIRRAGVSKGTFLYHFPSREKLVAALIEEYAAHLGEVMTALEKDSAGAYDPLLAGYEKWYRDFTEGGIDNGSSPLVPLVTASQSNRKFLTPVRGWYWEHFDKLKASPNGETTALLLTLAFDALFFHRLFGTDVLRDEEKNELLSLMHKLAQGEARIVECSGRDPEKKANFLD